MKDDTLDIGPRISGAALRSVLVAVVAVAVILLQPGIGWEAIAVIVAIAGAIVPMTGLAWLALIVVPFALLAQPMELWRVCLAVLVIHAGHVLATLILTMPLRSRIALRALRPTAVRFVLVQVVAQAMAAVAVLLSATDAVGIAWLAPVGALAVAVFTVLMLRRVD